MKDVESTPTIFVMTTDMLDKIKKLYARQLEMLQQCMQDTDSDMQAYAEMLLYFCPGRYDSGDIWYGFDFSDDIYSVLNETRRLVEDFPCCEEEKAFVQSLGRRALKAGLPFAFRLSPVIKALYDNLSENTDFFFEWLGTSPFFNFFPPFMDDGFETLFDSRNTPLVRRCIWEDKNGKRKEGNLFLIDGRPAIGMEPTDRDGCGSLHYIDFESFFPVKAFADSTRILVDDDPKPLLVSIDTFNECCKAFGMDVRTESLASVLFDSRRDRYMHVVKDAGKFEEDAVTEFTDALFEESLHPAFGYVFVKDCFEKEKVERLAAAIFDNVFYKTPQILHASRYTSETETDFIIKGDDNRNCYDSNPYDCSEQDVEDIMEYFFEHQD